MKKSKDRGLAYQGDGMTVLELVDKYTLQKRGIKHTIQASYRMVLNILKNDPFGVKRIDKVKLSDAKKQITVKP